MTRLCHTCRLLRPRRAKHCRICQRCVDSMDHHCNFLHNCVGPKNRWDLSVKGSFPIEEFQYVALYCRLLLQTRDCSLVTLNFSIFAFYFRVSFLIYLLLSVVSSYIAVYMMKLIVDEYGFTIIRLVFVILYGFFVPLVSFMLFSQVCVFTLFSPCIYRVLQRMFIFPSCCSNFISWIWTL